MSLRFVVHIFNNENNEFLIFTNMMPVIWHLIILIYRLYVRYILLITWLQLIDGRSGVKRNVLQSTSTGSAGGTSISIHVPQSGDSLPNPLLSHSSFDGSDPLSQFAREELDPLSKMAADEVFKLHLLKMFIHLSCYIRYNV